MKRTLNIFGSCMVLVGLVLMLGAAGMSDACSGSMDCVITRMLTGLAFLAVGAAASGLAEIQKRGDK